MTKKRVERALQLGLASVSMKAAATSGPQIQGPPRPPQPSCWAAQRCLHRAHLRVGLPNSVGPGHGDLAVVPESWVTLSSSPDCVPSVATAKMLSAASTRLDSSCVGVNAWIEELFNTAGFPLKIVKLPERLACDVGTTAANQRPRSLRSLSRRCTKGAASPAPLRGNHRVQRATPLTCPVRAESPAPPCLPLTVRVA